MRRIGLETLAFSGAAPDPRHIGLDPGLIKEDQAAMVEAADQAPPCGAFGHDISAFLLLAVETFF